MEPTAYTTVEAFLKSRSPYNVRSVAVYSLDCGESLNIANTNYTGSVRGLLYITVCPSTVAHNQKREGCLLLKYTCVVEIEGTEYGKVFRALVLPQNLQTIRQTTLQYARGTNFKYHYGEVMTFLDDRYCVERFESDSAMNLFAKANWVKNQLIDAKSSTLTEGSLLIFTQLLHRESDNKLPANFKFIDGNATIWNLICARKSVAAGCVEVKCTKLGENAAEIDKFIYKPFPSNRLLEWKKTRSNTLGTDPINQIIEANKKANLKSNYTKKDSNTVDMVGPLIFRVFNPTATDFDANKDKPVVNEKKEEPSEIESLFPRTFFDNLNFIDYETLTKIPPDKETNLIKSPVAKQMCSIVAAFCKKDDTFVTTNSNEPSSNEVEMDDMELNCLFEHDSPTLEASLTALDTAKPITVEPETYQTADASLNVDDFGASTVPTKKLVKVKTSEYIRKHPELKSQLSTYVIAVLREQPEDLQTFAARFFGQALRSLDQLTFKESLDVSKEDFKGSVNGNLNISVCPSTVTHYQERRNCLLLKYSCAVQIGGVEYGKTLRALILPDNLQTIRQITMRYAKGDKFNRFNGEIMNFYNDRYAVENFESDSILDLFTKAKWSKLKPIVNGVATLTEGSLIIVTRLLSQKWDHKSPVNLKFIDANAKIWDLKCERNHPKTSRVQIKCTKTLQYEREVDSFTYKTTRWRLENLIRWKKTGSEIAGMHQINQILEAQRLKPRKAQRYNPVTKTNVLARITTCKYRILQSPNGERTRFHDSDSDTDNFAKEQTKIPEPPRMNEWDKVFPPRLFDNLSFIAYETNCKSPDRQTKIPTSKRKSKTPCQLQMSTFFADFCKEEDKNTKTDWNKTDLELSEIHEDLNLNLLFDKDCGTVDNPKVTEFTNVKEDLMPNVEENLKCATELCAGVIELIVEGHITQTSKTAKTASQQSTDFDTRMSEAQQIVKRRTLDYIQRHPELKSQLSSYLSKVIKEQPEDLHSFAADFFSRIK